MPKGDWNRALPILSKSFWVPEAKLKKPVRYGIYKGKLLPAFRPPPGWLDYLPLPSTSKVE